MVEKEEDQLIYRGKVGTGFSDKLMKELKKELDQRVGEIKPIEDKVLDTSFWLAEFIPCEVEYSELTQDGNYRDPVFKKARFDQL